MSLRPDDRKSRGRSKSPGRERSRSRSNVRGSSPGPQYYGSSAEHGYDAAAAAPQYEVRQPGQLNATQGSEPITMGGYADLPPAERPGYMQQAQQAAHYQYSVAPTAPRSPTGPNVSYAQPGNVQYSTGQYSYATAPSHQGGGVARTPSNAGGFQYAAPPDKIQFTAKPVTAKSVVSKNQPPLVRHTSNASSPPYQTVQPQYNAIPHAPPPLSSAPSQHAYPPPPSAHPEYTYPPSPSAQPQHAYPPSPSAHPQQAYPPQPSASPAQHAYPPPPAAASQHAYPPPPMGRHSPQSGHHRAVSHSGPHKVVEMIPGGIGKPPPSPGPGRRPHSLSVGGLAPRMDRLSVSGNRPDIQTIVPGGMPGGFPGGGLPPPSPLLEAYHGTYQSLSPMPQAMMFDDDLDHLQPLDSHSPRGSSMSFHGDRRRAHSISKRSPSPSRKSKSSKPSKSSRFEQDKMALQTYGRVRDDQDRDHDRDHNRPAEKRRVKIYDAEDDALDLVHAMTPRNVDANIIVDIIPTLSHDQLLELRREYKKHCKVQGRGINIAKHIKLKTTGTFGKIAYVTALGKYESEGYWANYWYQSNSARRELLIEALMGRQNHEIREIKDAFKDKRYSDSLTKCMDKELKADKFRKAILLALEGERQEESDSWPTEYKNRDVDTLYNAMKAREGGESVMLEIVVMRSDAHLREVLRTYERKYGGNFARDALRKSNNLVGEVIAHILNGVINRPARDAMLLHHALMDLIEPSSSHPSKSSSSRGKESSSKHERQQRNELLISRLVRFHWDRMHLSRVKIEYEEKYGKVVEEDVEEATTGDFREFCIALCQTGR